MWRLDMHLQKVVYHQAPSHDSVVESCNELIRSIAVVTHITDD